MSSLLQAIINENKRLSRLNKALEKKLSVAIEGLEVLVSDGDILGIPQKTLNEINLLDKELPQDNNTNN